MDCFERPPESTRSGSRYNKHSEAVEIYKCQCGRQYLTFSALYLHVSLKHGQKLSTRRNESNPKIQKINNKTIVSYFLQDSENITQNLYNNRKKQKDLLKSIKLQSKKSKTTVILQYLVQLQKETEFEELSYSIFQSVMKSFVNYLKIVESLPADELDREVYQADLTEYFNEFSTYYLPQVEKKSKFDSQVTVKVLHRFYLWMKKKDYTWMELQCNVHQSNKQQS